MAAPSPPRTSQDVSPERTGDQISPRSLPSRYRDSPGSLPEKQSTEDIHQPPAPQVAKLTPPLGHFIINTLLQIAAFAAAIAFGIYAVKSVTVGNDANGYAAEANKYAAQAVRQAQVANELALMADQMAMISVCLATSNQTGNLASLCSQIISAAASVLPAAAESIFTNLPTPEPTTTTTSSKLSASSTLASPGPTQTAPSNNSSSATSPKGGHAASHVGAIVGGVVGGVVGLVLLVGVLLFMTRRRKSRSFAPQAIPATQEEEDQNVPNVSQPGISGLGIAKAPQVRSRGLERWFRATFVDSLVTTG